MNKRHRLIDNLGYALSQTRINRGLSQDKLCELTANPGDKKAPPS